MIASFERNPFPCYGLNDQLLGWRWVDEEGNISSDLYPTQIAALRALIDYVEPPAEPPGMWRRLWDVVVEFWHDGESKVLR